CLHGTLVQQNESRWHHANTVDHQLTTSNVIPVIAPATKQMTAERSSEFEIMHGFLDPNIDYFINHALGTNDIVNNTCSI
ncbi:hypothetical protein KI387_032014, partial [Taxus chinensis]